MLRQLERYSRQLFLSLLKGLVGSDQPADIATRLFERILVIRQHDQLGDMLCVVPLLRGLRQRYPHAYIALMSSPVSHDVMLGNPYVDHVIKYDKRDFLAGALLRLGKFLSFIRALRKEKFEIAIVPSTVSTSTTSDLFAYLCGASYRLGTGEINGVKNRSGFFFNFPVTLTWEGAGHRHQTLRNLDTAHALWLSVTDLSLTIKLSREEVDEANAFVAGAQTKPGAFISFHPGAGKPPNRWPALRFAELANRLAQEGGFGTMVTSGPMDNEPVSTMKSNLAHTYQVVEGKNIRQVAAILSLARCVITNDTGIMHVAAAVGTPVLSLFGPTDPEQWAPIGTKHRYIVGRDGVTDSISVEEVVVVAKEMLR